MVAELVRLTMKVARVLIPTSGDVGADGHGGALVGKDRFDSRLRRTLVMEVEPGYSRVPSPAVSLPHVRTPDDGLQGARSRAPSPR